MSGPDLTTLAALSAARLAQARARLKGVMAEEARLRAALARLAEQAEVARTLPSPALEGVRGIGADLTWQDWVARQRAALQMELALVLARKEQALPALRRAFGKSEAAHALAERARVGRQRQRIAREARALAELGLLGAHGARSGEPPDQAS